MGTKRPTRPAVRTAHDWISVNFGGGRSFTVSRSGSKGTNIPRDVFEALHRFVSAESAKPGGSFGAAFTSLSDHIDSLWPEWAEVPTFAVGALVFGPDGRRGRVVKHRRQNLEVQFDGEKHVTIVSPALLESAGDSSKGG